MAARATQLQRRVGGLLLLGGGMATILPAAVPAQVVQVSPIANLSFPTKVSFRDGTIHVSQKVGFRFGARVTLTFSERFDVTNTFTYSSGYATLHGTGKRIGLSSGSHSLAGSTAARYWLRPPGRPLSWEMNTGVGMIVGGQPSYLDLFDTSTLTAFLGTAVRYQVGEIVSLSVKLQQRLFRLQFGESDGGQSQPLRMTFGVGLPILERLR